MSCVSLATPGKEACAAAGGAFMPEWREGPGKEYWASLVRGGRLSNTAVCVVCITFLVARNPFRVDAKRGDHFLQAGLNKTSKIFWPLCRWLKSSRRNQRCFAFNHFPNPATIRICTPTRMQA